MQVSKFGQHFTRNTGARELMDDLGAALAGDDPVMMLGGGNPAHIPAVEDVFRARLREVISDERAFQRMFGNYADPAGEIKFRTALAGLLKREYGWDLGPANIALTAGSQGGFFLLFNLLAGEYPDGSHKRILLPVTPEYVGYEDLGVTENLFIAQRPSIEQLDDQMFKYHVNFADLCVGDDVSAICVSRPTNPTGNVLTDDEILQLAMIAEQHSVPLIVDNAYGMPFPQIVFTDVRPVWSKNIILCMSLSKLGLPAIRTGIVVASEEVIDALAGMNAVVNLAVSSVGAVLLQELVESGEIIKLSSGVIRPYYQERVEQTVAWVHESLAGAEYRIHKPEGALFLWLWFPGLPIGCEKLYQRLKERDVLVISGHHFFPGIDKDWPHCHECIRVNYSQDRESVRQGIKIIGEEIKRAYDAA